MLVQVELLVHHGGRMRFNGRVTHYVGGEVVEVTFDSDFLCYFQLIKFGTEDLKYDSVDRIWFVAPRGDAVGWVSPSFERRRRGKDMRSLEERGRRSVLRYEHCRKLLRR
ncbi:hypothetical protein LINPERHAP2_LOCUS3803 [Linum perenne]